MDRYVIVLGILLIATLVAFFTGLFPYPVGWMVILVLIGIRLMHKIRKRQNNEMDQR